MNVTDNEPVWRRTIDHSSIQNRTSEPKSRSLDSVRVQTNEEITVAIEICGSLKTRVNPNRSTEGSASGYSRNSKCVTRHEPSVDELTLEVDAAGTTEEGLGAKSTLCAGRNSF